MFIFFWALSSWGETLCPAGDLKACQTYLKSLNETEKSAAFTEKYDQVCQGNKNFRCVKTIVRGDVTEEMKMMSKERGPKAALFSVEINDDKFVYVLMPK